MAFAWGQLHRKYPRYQSLIWLWKLSTYDRSSPQQSPRGQWVKSWTLKEFQPTPSPNTMSFSITHSNAAILCMYCISRQHTTDIQYLNGLVQERRNSGALAMELRLSRTNPSICPNTSSVFALSAGPRPSATKNWAGPASFPFGPARFSTFSCLTIFKNEFRAGKFWNLNAKTASYCLL